MILLNGAGGGSIIGMVVWIAVLFGVMYFLMIRPQRKDQQKKDLMLKELAVGDTVLTTAGFYGVVIDIDLEDDVVIVEFGSNKNCRIPMKRAAITEVEKPEESLVVVEDKKDKKKKEK